jgi:hypothetical protein
MNLALFMAVAGAAAALLMITIEYAFVWTGVKHGDLIRLLGATLVHKPKNVFKIGLLINAVAGILLSALYFAVLNFFRFDTLIENMGIGAFLGVAQGFILMDFLATAMASTDSPAIDEQSNLPASFAHWMGHILFGSVLGALIGGFLVYGQRGFLIAVMIIVEISTGVLYFSQKRMAATTEA